MNSVWLILLTFIEYSILALLFGLSSWSVAIMIERKRFFARFEAEPNLEQMRAALTKRDLAALRQATTGAKSPAAGVIREALQVDALEIDRAVRAYLLIERNHLEKGMSVLATLGSNAPFIGLLGTVLGIIQAFAVLAGNQTQMTMVMGSLSKALVATAVGLLVAIPAVVAFNYFSRKIRVILTEAESMRDQFVAAFPDFKTEKRS